MSPPHCPCPFPTWISFFFATLHRAGACRLHCNRHTPESGWLCPAIAPTSTSLVSPVRGTWQFILAADLRNHGELDTGCWPGPVNLARPRAGLLQVTALPVRRLSRDPSVISK
ncbi:hypothetical protein B0T17DRAFT_524715 [Bombardia bombarda]|uniref:Secreted protein n=1 Tax=Bombardia bombarda TaxID=252184 RepID=A0AA40C858_9PEZI|nr:hypothetical protein B0T17DRAFT_524715 [Bombardia bombarda]